MSSYIFYPLKFQTKAHLLPVINLLVVELGLLIGNKVEERVALKIDHIRLK